MALARSSPCARFLQEPTATGGALEAAHGEAAAAAAVARLLLARRVADPQSACEEGARRGGADERVKGGAEGEPALSRLNWEEPGPAASA